MRIYWLRLAPVFLGIFVLAWFVPQLYLRATRADYLQLSAVYSSVKNDFIIFETGPSVFQFRDEEGNRISQRDGRMALPYMFSRDVEKWGGFPMSINGRSVTFRDAQEGVRLRATPREVMLPQSRVLVLMESTPETASFSLPPDIMLLDDTRLRFVNCADGKENTDKGTAFTAAVLAAGAQFPLQAAGSNADPYKGLDEGLFFVDASGTLFQLLMVRGKPECRNTGHHISGKALRVDVRENKYSDLLGTIATETGLYINRRGQAPMRLPLQYQPDVQNVSVWATPLDATFNVSTLGSRIAQDVLVIAADGGLKIIRNLLLPPPASVVDQQITQQRWLSFLCPLNVVQFEPRIAGISLKITLPEYPLWAAGGNLLSLILLLAARKRQGNRRMESGTLLRTCAPEILLVLVFGLPALLTILVAGPLARMLPQGCHCGSAA